MLIVVNSKEIRVEARKPIILALTVMTETAETNGDCITHPVVE